MSTGIAESLSQLAMNLPLVADRRRRGIIVSIAAAIVGAGCGMRQPLTGLTSPTVHAAEISSQSLAPGVVHRAISTTQNNGIDIVDVDLKTADVHLAVGAEDIRRDAGAIVGRALMPSQWVQRGALVGVNGGYFGAEHPTALVQQDASNHAPVSEEIVGLLVQHGKVRHASPSLLGHGGNGLAPGRYTRSAFGVMPGGTPDIVWAATDGNDPQVIRAFPSATVGASYAGRPWKPSDAVGCGPTLITAGRAVLSDRSERLVSEGPLPRTFVAYDRDHGTVRHVLIGIASGATFSDLTAEISAYFSKYHRTQAWAAMCLDGGSSTQMTYRVGHDLYSPRDTGVAVPDCLLIEPGRIRLRTTIHVGFGKPG